MKVHSSALLALSASLALSVMTVTANAGPHADGPGASGMNHSSGSAGRSSGTERGAGMGHSSHRMVGNWSGGNRGHGGHSRGGRGYGYGYGSGVYIIDDSDDYRDCYYRHHRRVCRD
ncbi:hypothetical protein SAMN04488557_2222 [Hyphomicrobium facile]|uniref:Uncharacterized protein n=1 Tax=Hyphomicrobium facile TaxID=51670 RepID=A0A1I7NHF8_9HYPH|nr:hypothetical protein SAMN04488557_2222 [Hyphomicrobium facile]